MVEVTVNKTQKVLGVLTIAITFSLSILFSQLLNFHPDWRFGAGYIVFGTLASVFLYFTFFNNVFISV